MRGVDYSSRRTASDQPEHGALDLPSAQVGVVVALVTVQIADLRLQSLRRGRSDPRHQTLWSLDVVGIGPEIVTERGRPV